MERSRMVFQRSCTALEAPAGYGKTTLVHKLLDSSDDNVYWYTAVESVPDTSFRWFIRQISLFDEDAARRLDDLGYLNRSNAGQAARIISEVRTAQPVVLVFDNFQFSLQNWYPEIISSLAMRSPDGLRTIFISQNYGSLREVFHALQSQICFIQSQDLLLSLHDIRDYAAQLGVSASPEEIEQIKDRTEGWAAAVALCLSSLKEVNFNLESQDMDGILYDLFWSGLSANQKDGLLSLCLFDRLSDRTIEALLLPGTLEKAEAKELLSRTPMVRYYQARGEYYPHEILLRFLRDRMGEKEESFRQQVLSQSGVVYKENGMVREAVNCFYKAKDHARLFECKLVCLITEEFDGVSYTQLAAEVLQTAPEKILKEHLLSVLRLCYALYAGCQFDAFEEQMKRAKRWIKATGNEQLMGEWHLLYALSSFPNIAGMKKSYLAAESLMESPSELFTKEEPFLFGCTSMWYLFYSEPGKMLKTADALDDLMSLYNRLTNGHAAGAAEIYRGEAYSVQGRFEESDILAYQAAFLSEQYGNSSATYGAALLLGINAIYRSDMTGLQKAIDYLENKARGYSFLKGKMLNNYMVETVRGYLLGLMMETGRSALWTQGDADALDDLTFTTFMIKTCRITDLLLKKEYKRAIASVEASLQLDPRLISTSTQNFMYCGLALCYLAIGRVIKAAENLDKSLTIAGRDKNYTFLACFRRYFQVLFLMPSIASKHAKTIKEIKAVNIRYTRANETRIFAMLDEVQEFQNTLTDREREVAELAAQGLHNNEIANRLNISENTVKHHLKVAFQKMNIDRRGKLVEMLK